MEGKAPKEAGSIKQKARKRGRGLPPKTTPVPRINTRQDPEAGVCAAGLRLSRTHRDKDMTEGDKTQDLEDGATRSPTTLW